MTTWTPALAPTPTPGGGQKGEMAIFDLRQQRQRAQWSAHSLAARSLALDARTGLCFSASSDGDMKLCDLAPATPCPSMPTLQGCRAV